MERQVRTRGPAGELAGIVLPFLATLLAAAAILRLLNGLPEGWQRLTAGPPPVRMALNERLEYASVEEAAADLGVTVELPRYFPDYLEWPAASVRGQKEPATVVSLLFRSRDGQQGLQIRELFWPGPEPPFPVPEPAEVVNRREVELNGVAGQLLEGRGQGGVPVNQLRWRAGGTHFVVTTIYPTEELLRICRSIRAD